MKKIISLILVFTLALTFAGCKKSEEKPDLSGFTATRSETNKPYTYVFDAFDTTCSISLYGITDDRASKMLCDDLVRNVRLFEDEFSKTKEGSEIYDINHRTTDFVMISDSTADVMELGSQFYEWSKNKFDISCGTLIDLWDIKNRKTLPSKEEVNEAKSHCGNFNYTIERNVDNSSYRCNRITFHGDPKSQYDLGALVKGYCCDTLKAMIEEMEVIEAAIINLGGNVCCVGQLKNRKDGKFNIGIFKPFSGNELIDKVEVVNRNVITSGNYQRYFKVPGDDRIYHHILDPSTGYPSNNELNSVTIVSQNGLLGDYLSTSCMLLGTEEAKKLIDFANDTFDDKNIQAIFVDKKNKVTRYPKKVKLY